MAYKIKRGKDFYQMNIKGAIIRARTRKELEKKINKEPILWHIDMNKL